MMFSDLSGFSVPDVRWATLFDSYAVCWNDSLSTSSRFFALRVNFYNLLNNRDQSDLCEALGWLPKFPQRSTLFRLDDFLLKSWGFVKTSGSAS